MAKNGKMMKMTKLKNLSDSEDVYIKENVLPVHKKYHFNLKLTIWDFLNFFIFSQLFFRFSGVLEKFHYGFTKKFLIFWNSSFFFLKFEFLPSWNRGFSSYGHILNENRKSWFQPGKNSEVHHFLSADSRDSGISEIHFYWQIFGRKSK